MEIRKTTENDLPQVLELYEQARNFMREQGNPNQWGDSYPPKALVMEDIQNQESYVCEQEGEILGTFYFSRKPEPDYETIHHGEWLEPQKGGVVHRITAKEGSRGVASFCLNYCLQQCGAIKIDTHRDNIPMQKALLKNGFQQCGIIYLADGSERLAFQKIQ